MDKSWAQIGKSEEFLEDKVLIRRINFGGECAIVRHEGKLYSFGSVCPHQNMPFDGATVTNCAITCRMHGYRFSLKTGDCENVGGYGMPLFRVREVAGRVEVEV